MVEGIWRNQTNIGEIFERQFLRVGMGPVRVSDLVFLFDQLANPSPNWETYVKDDDKTGA